ncbi:ABC transporter permease [Lachnoclostridium phytofermentans]|uniref:ABC transporter permease n=1 Tax=Lachnoclostridium phytofermentans TaxID=66219 RepID=UPI000AC14627|nr:ABC transporter permease subunit [Lachnoclostridium phytofermentans]
MKTYQRHDELHHIKRMKSFKKSKELYLLLFLPILYFIIFKYGAMFWMVVAFEDYDPIKGVLKSEWVGLKWFKTFLQDPYFLTLIKNTVLMNVWCLLFYFPVPIILALMINEVRQKKLKKVVQTISYLPYFFSVVVICGLIVNVCSLDGLINQILSAFGMEKISFLNKPEWFRPIYVLSEIWQKAGWSSIIYLAALSSVDVQLYEAAVVDGASRLKQIIHISLPGIASVISIQLLLALGEILSVGYEKIMLLYNGATMETADVISTYVYRRGIISADFSYGTAVNLFQAIIGLTTIILANKAAQKAETASLW